MKLSLPTCPVCGAKAFISRDVVDGFYFGWSVGCPRYSLYDGIHGCDEYTPIEKRFAKFNLDSYKDCVDWWVKRCKEEE